ncbi:MAG TPA: ArsA-related P-loop ATPase [Thermoanaerobaculia bacterium]|jgi:anion-transporting  ArsA/GET3 family ATPase|nr:ArsA-related P-loop ATPase [Thermoanaerobaculia bacterium]
MDLISGQHPLIIVVGSGGVGKTTLAASLGVLSARDGRDTLVMTFDPSLRLKQTLGVGEEAKLKEVPVALDAPGALHASLLDARLTFDRLIERYAPDEEARRRVLENRFYQNLSGTLGGILEYMAVERLFEVASDGRYGQVVLDTPPTRQALDFLEAPRRIVGFLESGALRVALKPWFDEEGRLRAASKWGPLGRRAERFLDEVVGMDLLRDMAEFFQAFGSLYEGFRQRALEVEELLRSRQTLFVLVTGPGEERIPDTLFFARHLEEAGYNLGPIVVNRVHPRFVVEGAPPASHDPCRPTGWELLSWAGERDRRGLVELAKLLSREQPLVDVPLQPDEPTDLPSLEALGRLLESRLSEWERYVSRTS